jgi:hypothetical protein
MSRELDLLAREYQKKSATVMTTNLLIDQKSLQSATSSFIREVEQQCKKRKAVYVKWVAVID